MKNSHDLPLDTNIIISSPSYLSSMTVYQQLMNYDIMGTDYNNEYAQNLVILGISSTNGHDDHV